MTAKTIKGISNEKWVEFKTLAYKNNLPLGKLLEIMVKEYSRKEDPAWEIILKGEKIITKEEAENLSGVTKKLRKERGFRNVINH